MTALPCELCEGAGGRVIHDDARLRVVAVDDPDYPGFMRVIWNAHVREMTDLSAAERDHFMHAVFAVEQSQRAVMGPHKMNIASLGNMTPHLHWHLIPRFEDDAHFPKPIWAKRQRSPTAASLAARTGQLPALERAALATLTTSA
jgi:diadenosine tetraphosphate (Ap4A) HIT family hydrolase